MPYVSSAYRTSAGRAGRQLSRPETPSSGSGAANDNFKMPNKPANDNFPANLPRYVDKLIKRPAVRRAAQTVFMAHPLLRAFSLGWKLYDLYDHLKRVKVSPGEYQLACDVGVMSACSDAIPCSETSYCAGPSFSTGLNSADLCGIAGQAGIGGLGYFLNAYYLDGVITWMHRGQSSPPAACHPGKMIAQWRNPYRNNSPKNTAIHPPQHVPWVRTTPAPWQPFRFYKPEIFMKPQVDFDVPPLPPPYDYIPERDKELNVERGNRVSEELGPRLQQQLAPRFRPPARTKETKVKWTGPAQIMHAILVSLGKVHGKMADLRDIVGAIEKTLPKGVRLKGKDAKSIPKQMENLFRHWDKIQGEQAVLNIIEELAEDLVGGAGDRLRQEAASNFGWLKNKIHLSPRF